MRKQKKESQSAQSGSSQNPKSSYRPKGSGERQSSYSSATAEKKSHEAATTQSVLLSGEKSESDKESALPERVTHCGCCPIDIRIDSRGDINMYNCSPPDGTHPGKDSGTATTPGGCFPPVGSCFPAVPGAKHKQGRNRMLANLAARARVPSTLAASTLHLARRFVLGKTPANALEKRTFALLEKVGADTLSCMVTAFDGVPTETRKKLFTDSLLLDPDQPLEETAFVSALTDELRQRIGVEVFADPDTEERPGQMRIFEPGPEDFFSQVRICRINGLRTANFFPFPTIGEFLPGEIQQDCTVQIVNGQANVICQPRTTDCPGNSLGPVCARVVDVSQGDGVVLEGVNYFSVDTKVQISEKITGNLVTEVDGFVHGDLDTPRLDDNGQLINDCRVHDRLSFQVPKDLLPGIYQVRVAVPNATGFPQFGEVLLSNIEFINVLPPPTARFQIVAERISAREETSPATFGSDEVGLQTLAFPLFATGELGTDENARTEMKFEGGDFDSGDSRIINRLLFQHSQPILGMGMVVFGDEIDSQDAYDKQLKDRLKIFTDLLKDQFGDVKKALAELGGLSALLKFGTVGLIIAGAIAIVVVGYDIITALWAPADPIIRDSFALSVSDLETLTNANSPAPDPRQFESEEGIVVNVGSIAPVKLPLEYHETREYVSDEEDSRYEITYRFNRIA
jgi:hypothetical protein